MILPDKEQFDYKECEISGDKCWLITPKRVDIKWNHANSRFRSCIVRQEDNFVVSQGFKKFTNMGEQPDFESWDNDWKFEARHKLDGSCLIVSKYKDDVIIRTRGTVDARQLENGYEIDILLKKYPEVFNNKKLDNGYTLLLEWTTPSNIIVLREHEEPTLTLLAIIHNETGCYVVQSLVDKAAIELMVDRPKKYEYSSIQECIQDVKGWKGKEGVVLYSPSNQILKKIKADAYLELHKLATGITSINQVLDVFLASPKFIEWKEFYNYVKIPLDYEIAEKCKDHIQRICEAYKKVLVWQMMIIVTVNEWMKDNTKKETALRIQEYYSIPWQKAYAFCVLNGNEPNERLSKSSIEFYL